MKSHVSYRISSQFLADDDRFDELVSGLKENRGGFESLVLFTAITHSVITLEIMRKRCDILKKRIAELKGHGWEVGIDLLCSVGFFLEFKEAIPDGFVSYTKKDGLVDQGTFCPNHAKYRDEYLGPLLRLLVATEPDFIWLDDDSCKPACWCDHCMDIFNGRQATNFSRDQLHRAFNEGPWRERLSLRQAHLDFETETNRNLLSFVENTVHAIDPVIGLGMMTYNDRLDTAELPAALAGPTSSTVLWRPGGGAWNDQCMDDFLLRKGGNIANECAWLPDRVDRIQAEIESFNYQPLLKSIHATVMESCIYTAAGCNGVAYNLFDGYEPLEPYKAHMTALTRIRPFLEELSVVNGRVRPRGIYSGWTPRRNAARGLDGGDWLDPRCWEDTNANDFAAAETATRGAQIFVAGVPPAYRLSEAQATVLCNDTAWSLSDEELREILSLGLYCDVKTLQILHLRGMGDLTGFRAVTAYDLDVRERMVPHSLNGTGAGCIREGRQSFIKGYPGWALERLDGRGEVLAELIDYNDQVVADISMGAYENVLGGRVVVAGYFATRHLLFDSKINQIKNIFRWLSHDTLTAYITSFHRIALWVRSPGGNGCENVIALINASMDQAENVELLVQGNESNARLTCMTGNRLDLTGTHHENRYVKFIIPSLEPWSVNLLEIG